MEAHMKANTIFSLIGIFLILMAGCTKAPEPVASTAPLAPIPTSAASAAYTASPDGIAPQATAVVPPERPLSRLPGVDELIAGLQGLDFDTFVDQSYHSLMVRNPELLTTLALSASYGLRDDLLTDISDAYVRQTQVLENTILDLLRSYDRSTLQPEQQLTYDIYVWFLQDRVAGHAFMYDDYPLNVTVFSLHNDLLQFFTDIHPVANLQNAQDYVTRLWQVNTKLQQLIEGLRLRQQAGVVLPAFLIGYVQGEIQSIANASARLTPYFTSFTEKLAPLSSISPEQQAELLVEAESAINQSVLPGYQAVDAYLDELAAVATYDEGVWKFPDGPAYYAYMLSHYTTTSLTADQIHALGIQELQRIQTEMRAQFAALGYPSDAHLPDLYGRLATDGGMLSGPDIVATYERIINAADTNVSSAFDLRPSVGVIVVGGPTGGYYTSPALDGSRPGMFYAQNTGSIPWYTMPTLAYHEAIPGHHFQIAIAQHLDLPSIRRASEFTAYVEGWALYAERLAWELGFYAGDPYGDLGRLQMEAFRAARLVVDTGLHAQGWSFDQAVDFMVENTGRSIGSVQAEVSRYICIPGQATSYYIGYQRLLELRQQMMTAQGEAFDLREFHNLVLGSGAVPLDILTQVFQDRLDNN
jgi:uncharacterized protein (DUF885 family)